MKYVILYMLINEIEQCQSFVVTPLQLVAKICIINNQITIRLILTYLPHLYIDYYFFHIINLHGLYIKLKI